MSENFSKSIVWEVLLNICQPKAESKELLELFEINALSMSFYASAAVFQILMGPANIVISTVIRYFIDPSLGE